MKNKQKQNDIGQAVNNIIMFLLKLMNYKINMVINNRCHQFKAIVKF